MVEHNLHDYDVGGVVVFRAFPWPFKTYFSNTMVDLLTAKYNIMTEVVHDLYVNTNIKVLST